MPFLPTRSRPTVWAFVRIAIDWGILELIGHEIRPSGERLVCREVSSGALYKVDRPQDWSAADEDELVDELKQRLDSVGRSRDGS